MVVTGKKDNKLESAFGPATAHEVRSQPVFSAPEEGFVLMRAFTRIRNPAVREALIELVSRLAKVSGD